MDRFEAMRTLLAAVDGGSLSAASRALHVPLATVSRRVSDLEARLGAQLLVRTSRRLQLTEEGAAYIAAARRILDELDEAERTVSGEYRAPRGELAVTAPIMFGKLHVAPIVHDFLAAYPDVSVRLILLDGVIDIVEAHIDLALRIGHLPDSALVARRLGEVRWMFCANPDYLDRRGTPAHPAELADHSCIAFEGLQRYRDWPYADGGQTKTVSIKSRFSVNTADAVVGAAAAGLGVARIMSYQAAQTIVSGATRPILDEYWPAAMPVHLLYGARQQQPLKLRAFLDFVTPRLQARLAEIGAGCGLA
ncbi:LysR family transcriptional regulator [Sphingomonas jaspsi]|uniref:LysR family transcriptional regulator n=1 Tax=Sphingomonas jaspsi TaxID=392409 RepID=UPI0004BC7AC8|nr:LysR family transcriptional regulator [Sphingomonas jaspsi]